MTYAERSPIPLRPDRAEAHRVERRSWSRAIAARALTSSERGSPEKILKTHWPHDERAALILRGAVGPTSTASSGLPSVDVVGSFRSLSPGSAAWRLFDHPSALKLNLQGVRQISVPVVGTWPAQPVFVGEGLPVRSRCGA